MIWTYNGYTSGSNEARITLRGEKLRYPSGGAYAIRKTFTIAGRIQKTSQADMLTAYEALKTALASDAGDFTWKFNDATESGESITSASTYTGIRVTAPEFPVGDGGEMSTYRHYSFQLSYIQLLAGLTGNEHVIVEITEEFSHTNPTAAGDGVYIPQANRAAQYQDTYPSGLHTVEQTGEVIGLFGYLPDTAVPSPFVTSTPPYFPGRTRIRKLRPRSRVDGRRTEFPTAYSYFFQSASPMTVPEPTNT